MDWWSKTLTAIPGNIDAINLVSAIVSLLAIAAAAALCFRTTLRVATATNPPVDHSMREAIAWAFITIGAIAALVGRVIYFYTANISSSPVESSTVADVGILAASILLFAAVIVMPWASSRGHLSALLIDAGIIICALITLSWPIFIGPQLQGTMSYLEPDVGLIVLTVTSLATLVLAFGAGLRDARPVLRNVAILISAAAVVRFVGVYGFYSWRRATETGQNLVESFLIINASMIAVFLLIAAAAHIRYRSATIYVDTHDARSPIQSSPRLWPLVVPYVFVIVILMVTIALDLANARLEYRSGMLIGLGITVTLLLTRLLMTLRTNIMLYQLANERSIRDSLTGLYNHQTIYWWLEREIARAGRSNHPVSVLFMDIDYFKRYNDTYGHPAGDQVLKSVSGIVQQLARSTDLVGRYGGEEFAIIAPGADRDGARQLAERIQHAVAEHRPSRDNDHIGITVSIGIATFPQDASDASSLMTRVDETLYQAKESGRNRIVITPPEVEPAATASLVQV